MEQLSVFFASIASPLSGKKIKPRDLYRPIAGRAKASGGEEETVPVEERRKRFASARASFASTPPKIGAR